MWRYRPCLGLSLQSGSEVIAWIDIINSSLASVYHIVKWTTEFDINLWNSTNFYQLLAFLIIMNSIYVAMGFWLIKGAIQRDAFVCKWWSIFSFIHSLILTITISWNSSSLLNQIQYLRHFELIGVICYFAIYKPYTCWIVWLFVNEIKSCGGLNETLKNFNNTQVEDLLYETLEQPIITTTIHKQHFNNNMGKECKHEIINEIENSVERKTSYNRNYEINMNDLSIDSKHVLGAGKFGLIRKGSIETESGATKHVAVKTLKTISSEDSSESLNDYKSLLTELKIMIYLGEHPNLVNLIGVCTVEIQKKNLWIVLELCDLGSLYDFLNQNKANHNINNNNGENQSIGVQDMQQWAFQIANGLEHLERKNVVHGDIAARNILLTNGKIAKIADFGLSRKLYRYSNFSNNSQTNNKDIPLPWRWMAIETLENFEFSSKSDVWSYGITLWEIFNWGQIPFNGLHCWNPEFVKQLRHGLCLGQPETACNEIYKIMKRCWNLSPQERPTFSELASIFKLKSESQYYLDSCQDKNGLYTAAIQL